MKRNLSAKDMKIVGTFRGSDPICEDCVINNGMRYLDSPIFHRCAREYKLICDACGEALAK